MNHSSDLSQHDETKFNMLSILLKLTLVPLFCIAGYVLNGQRLSDDLAVQIELFFSVSLIFGSIFTMLAILLMGRWWGLLIAVVISSQTYFLWDHYYAWGIFTLEALFVGLTHRWLKQVVLADILYWLILGGPLVMLCYHAQFNVPVLGEFFLGLPFDAALTIALKQPLNGVMNAMLATFVFFAIQAYRNKVASLSTRELLFNSLFAVILIPSLILVVILAQTVKYERESSVQEELKITAQLLSEELQQQHDHLNRHNASVSEENSDVVLDTQPDFSIENYLNITHSKVLEGDIIVSYVPELSKTKMEKEGTLPISMQPGRYREVADQLAVWQPQEPGMASMMQWNLSVYYYHYRVNLGDQIGTLVVEKKAGSTINELHQANNKVMILLAIIIFFAGLLAVLISRILTAPLVALSKASTDIPVAISQSRIPRIGTSRIVEVHELSRNINIMTESLGSMFAEIRESNQLMEGRVRERTAELLEQTTRLNLANKATEQGVWDFDPVNNHLIWDDRMYEIYGVDRHQFSHAYEAWSTVVYPDDLALAEAQLQSALKGELEFKTIFRIKRPDGQVRFIQAYAEVIRDQTGKPVRMVGVNVDVTRVREMQDEISKQAMVLSKSTNAVVITTPDGRIEWVNHAFSELTGYELSEVAGKKPGQVLQGPGTSRETIAFIREKLHRKESFQTEILNYSKSGQPYWLEIRVDPIFDDHGQLVSYVGVESDITARKEAEARLLEETHRANELAQLAEAANQSKSEFLANMSHEIRTPLNGIVGMTELLQDSPLSEEQKEFTSTVKVCSEQLMSVINDILDFSKIDAGKLELECIPFSPSHVLQEVVKAFSQRATQKGILLRSETQGKVPQHVMGDPARLRQILFNLISNALKFTEAGEVSISLNSDMETAEKVQLQFKVSDTGIGIAHDRMDKLFKSFSQLDASTTRKYGGTGLGLAISNQLVNMMGGEIEVQSKLGQGSVFSFKIKLQLASEEVVNAEVVQVNHDQPSQSIQAFDQYRETWQRLKILLVEDNLDNQRVAQVMLNNKLGLKIDVVNHGAEALAVLSEQNYDLVLMDCQMPIMDGYEATRQIRQRSFPVLNPDVLIVAMTANAMRGDRERCLEVGMNDYIAKPIEINALKEVLYRVFQQLKLDEMPQARSKDNLVMNHEHEVEDEINNLGESYLSIYADDPDITEIIPIYLNNVTEQLKELQQAVARGESDQLARAAHQLKGSGGGYGYPLISSLAELLESQAKGQDMGSCKRLLEVFMTLIEKAQKGL